MIIGQKGNNPTEPHMLSVFAKQGSDVATLCWLTELAFPGHLHMMLHVALPRVLCALLGATI